MADLAEHLAARTSPPAPDEAVRPFLEAARRAMARFGWSRTTMRDIAREAGVERTTVYRHVGSMGDVHRLLVEDELAALVRSVPSWIPRDATGADIVVEVVARAVEHCWSHDLLTKVREDEPDLLGGLLVDAVPEVLDRLRDVFAPTVEVGVALGLLAPRDPSVVVDWCVRIGLTLLVAPPPGDLRTFLAGVLHPLLDPVGDHPPATSDHTEAT